MKKFRWALVGVFLSGVPASAAPVLVLSPDTLHFSATVGNAAPLSAAVLLTNSGTDTVRYSTFENSLWILSALPPTGKVGASGPGLQVTITVNPDNLAVGVHRDSVQFFGNFPSRWLHVVFTINPFPVGIINLSADSIHFDALKGGDLPDRFLLQITNAGAGSFLWVLSRNPQTDWLSAFPTVGVSPATIDVSVTDNQLFPGLYSDTLIFSSNTVSNSPQKVVVTYRLRLLRGDLNGDLALTSSDVVLLLNCVFGGVGVCPLDVADTNCDGVLSSQDVVLELNLVFLGQALPCL